MTPAEQRIELVRQHLEEHFGVKFTYPDAEALVAMMDKPNVG